MQCPPLGEPGSRHPTDREMAQLQQFVQGQLSLALTTEDSKLSNPFTDAALFSPTTSQQTREDSGHTDLASAFLLDQQRDIPSANGGMASSSVVANKTVEEAQMGEKKPSDAIGTGEDAKIANKEVKEESGELAEPAEEGKGEEEEVGPAEPVDEGGPKQEQTEERVEKEEQQPQSVETLETSGKGTKREDDLIRKQLAEIERELNRRVQNKNVKKMDEQEMSQLLLDHGLAGLRAAAVVQQQSALPFSSAVPVRSSPPAVPSMDQLRQPPLPPAFGPLAMGQPVYLASSARPPFGHFPQPDQPPFGAVAQPFAFQQPLATPFLPQQQPSQSPSPPFAQMLPPNLSAITPEMAAALLAQLQHQNPALLQSLVLPQGGQPPPPNLATENSSPESTNRISATFSASDRNGSCPAAQFSHQNVMPFSASSPPAPLPAPPRAAQSTMAGAPRRTPLGPVQQQQRRASLSSADSQSTGAQSQQQSAEWAGENGLGMLQPPAAGGVDPAVWVMRESFLRRQERERQRQWDHREEKQEQGRMKSEGHGGSEEREETDRLLAGGQQEQPMGVDKCAGTDEQIAEGDPQQMGGGRGSRKGSKKEVLIHEPAVLIEGVLFRARYLGSTQMSSDGRPTKSSRMAQAQEAVARVKAPEDEPQPSTEIDLFISTEKIMVLNTDLQRISETDVRQDILMDHSLRSISYIADIGDLVVLMARRVPSQQEQHPAGEGTAPEEEEEDVGVHKAARVICHVFESDESNFIAQSIGQAFQVAYMEFLRANGIEDPSYLRDIDYQEVLNSQEMMAEELELLARRETQKDVVVAKRPGEALGVVVVESGWGSMLPTVVIANMAPGGAAARSNQLNIGDQIIGINGISLVGLPLSAAQQNIKNARSSTAVRLTVVSTPPVVEVRIRRPDTKYQLGFSVQNGVICSLLRGGIAERGGIRVGHRIIEINHQSVVAVPHERIVNMLATATGEIHMKTMPTSMFRLLTGQEVPNYI